MTKLILLGRKFYLVKLNYNFHLKFKGKISPVYLREWQDCDIHE